VPAGFVRLVSDQRLDFPIRCELSRQLVLGGWDRIFSIGQLVPHEVAGIAGHDKNVFIGLGGKHAIDHTHFLGAVYGIETILARPHNPVRDVLSYMSGQLGAQLPITHLLTVRSPDPNGKLVTRGLFGGDGVGCFEAGAPLARDSNLELLKTPLRKVVVYLDPETYQSTWLGNKAVYRTRLALADGAELLVLAPGVQRFGEDAQIDALIRRHGYRGTAATLEALARDPELEASLAAAAHLIHGSSEGRFSVRYAAGGLDRSAIEGVGYEYADPDVTLSRYNPSSLRPGLNRMADGEEIFFIANPGLGLWATRERFAAAKAC
jgi:nickel-dependent lactate racemase